MDQLLPQQKLLSTINNIEELTQIAKTTLHDPDAKIESGTEIR